MDNAQAMLNLIADRDLTFTDLKVLIALQAVSAPDGWASATAQNIADHIGAHRPTVTLSLQRLAEKSIISGSRGRYRVSSRVTESMDDARHRRRVQLEQRRKNAS